MKRQIKFFLIFVFTAIYNSLFFFSVKRRYLNLFGYHVGRNSYIHSPVRFFSYSGMLSVGENCTINSNCYIDLRGGVVIGDNVNISHDVKIYTAGHDTSTEGFCYFEKKVVIGDDVWIFPNVIVMPGVTVGSGAVIYPGSVVARSVGEAEIVAGNPAKIIGKRKFSAGYRLDFGCWFAY